MSRDRHMLGRVEWIETAMNRLGTEGVEAVRVEALARDLHVSKGSFYWHFRDRADLLEAVMDAWERRETRDLNSQSEADVSAAERWAWLVRRFEDSAPGHLDLAIRHWAKLDPRVAARLAAVEGKRARLIARVLQEVGFGPVAAEDWAEIVLLVVFGWMERAWRDEAFRVSPRTLGLCLSQVVLAASGQGETGAH